jgi:hypothetical protein
MVTVAAIRRGNGKLKYSFLQCTAYVRLLPPTRKLPSPCHSQRRATTALRQRLQPLNVTTKWQRSHLEPLTVHKAESQIAFPGAKKSSWDGRAQKVAHLEKLKIILEISLCLPTKFKFLQQKKMFPKLASPSAKLSVWLIPARRRGRQWVWVREKDFYAIQINMLCELYNVVWRT